MKKIITINDVIRQNLTGFPTAKLDGFASSCTWSNYVKFNFLYALEIHMGICDFLLDKLIFPFIIFDSFNINIFQLKIINKTYKQQSKDQNTKPFCLWMKQNYSKIMQNYSCANIF